MLLIRGEVILIPHLLWGPMHGAVYYVGVRFNWERL